MYTFPAKRQKRLPFLRQSASITSSLFLYMAISTYLTSISRKVPPSEPPVAVTGISFLPAYLFALMYASAPEKFLHPSDSSSPDLSCPCRHYSCSPVRESHPTSVSYPCYCLSPIRQFVHKSTLLRTNCEWRIFSFFFQLSISYHKKYIKSTSIFSFFGKKTNQKGTKATQAFP